MPTIDEVLVLHHTHADIGYTHPQCVWWELSRRFLDEAIDLCERTADWPEPSRVRWTCEVTAPLLDWLDHAPARQIDRFRALCHAGQMSAGAMYAHVTQLYDADELARSLLPVQRLRQEFGLPVTAAIQHDVNGIPWTAHPLLRQAGVQLVVTGINRYFGGVAFRRPSLVRWAGPDGGELLALSGDIYHSFSRVLQPEHGDLAKMQAGLDGYIQRLMARGYPHRFIYLTATHLDFSDNNPPSPLMAESVRRWNAEGRSPVIRFASGDELARRMAAEPREALPGYAGDWSDWWAYGLGAGPREVAQSLKAKRVLRTAGMVRAARADTSPEPRLRKSAWRAAMLFDEHTFSAADSVYSPAAPETHMHRVSKEQLSVDAAGLAAMALRDELEAHAGNPLQGSGVQGVVVVNPSPVARCETVTVGHGWDEGRWTHISSKVHQLDWRQSGPRIGPVDVGPYECRWIPRADWSRAAPQAAGCTIGDGVIASPHYRLAFDAATGRIKTLTDTRTGQEVLNADAGWGAFELVQETLDPNGQEISPRFKGRELIFAIDYDRVHRDEPGWRTDWKASRQSPQANRVLARHEPDGVVLERHFVAGCGVRDLVIEVRLAAARPAVDVKVRFYKDDIRTPEGLYLALPLGISQWRAHWDGGALPVELEAGQLPDACHEFAAAGQWTAVHGVGGCAVLATPDMPLVQIGGFHFGRGNLPIDRSGPCLLLAWMMNNYWDTNFNVSQPGEQAFSYSLTTAEAFSASAAAAFAQAAASPLLVHPVVGACMPRRSPMLQLSGASLLGVKPAEGGGAIVVRVANPECEKRTARLQIPGLLGASRCGVLETERDALRVQDDCVEFVLEAQTIEHVCVWLRDRRHI